MKKIVKIFAEPCDCGSQIRHNNGGNYHEIVYLMGNNAVFSSTSELDSEETEWSPIDDGAELERQLVSKGYQVSELTLEEALEPPYNLRLFGKVPS